MTHYKYIHFLWGEDTKFSGPLVHTINNSPEVFIAKEHLFITPNERVFNALSSYGNVLLEQPVSASVLINKYGRSSDWIISHGLVSLLDSLRIRRKYYKKIVWRTWGASRQRSKWVNRHPLKSIFSLCGDVLFYYYMRYTFDQSPVFGIANVIDVIDEEQWGWNKNAKFLPFGYPSSSVDEIINNIDNRMVRNSDEIRILVGHQGDPNEHHVDFVRHLLSCKKDNLRIYLPLSYGNSGYIKETVDALNIINDSRVVVFNNLMPKDEYLELLASVDVAIFDGKTSMALGNIASLLHFRKKIFLNPDGIIRKAFEREGIPFGLTSQINSLSIDELIVPLEYPEPLVSDIAFIGYEKGVNNWVKLLSYLDSIKKNG